MQRRSRRKRQIEETVGRKEKKKKQDIGEEEVM